MQYSHIQYIIDNYSTAIQARLTAESRNISIDRAINTFLACDPTPGKKLVDWLVKTYIGGGFRWEDVEIGDESKLAEVLGLYQIYFNQIPREQRNIYLYKSYGELYTLLKPMIEYKSIENDRDTLGSREIKRKERARALEESEALYRSDECIIAVPLTQNAAKWWGRGTKWCIAADKNNRFDAYNQKAPLIVITLMNQQSDSSENKAGAEKFQLWMDGDDIQFMDAQDCEVSSDWIEDNWRWFKPIITTMIEKNGLMIQFVPDEFKTEELCVLAAKQNGLAIDYIPHILISLDICLAAIQQNGIAIRSIPEKYKNFELYKQAIESNWLALAYMNENLQTVELCEQAVRQNGRALDYVRDEFKTFALCKQAVKQNAKALNYIPDSMITDEICLLAVNSSGAIISSVPKHLRTPDICRISIEKNGLALGRLSNEMITKELCFLAVKQNGLALECVPDEMRTQEICMLAVEQDTIAVVHVPVNIRTYEMYKQAVEENGGAILYVPEEYFTSELLRIAIEQTPNALEYIPSKFITHDLTKLTYELAKLSVELWGRLDNIPKEYLTPEILETAKNYVGEVKPTDWDKSLLSNLKISINQSLKEQINDNTQSYPIPNR